MNKVSISIVVFSLLASCVSYEIDNFDFSDPDLAHLGSYKEGDTIYFISNLGDTDTIVIVGLGSEKTQGSRLLMAPPAGNTKWVDIEHLNSSPLYKGMWTYEDGKYGRNGPLICQPLIVLSKVEYDTATSIGIRYKNFYSIFLDLSELHRDDTVVLNHVAVTNYYLLTHLHLEAVKEPKDLEFVYWTDKYGLTGYKSKEGEEWIRMGNE